MVPNVRGAERFLFLGQWQAQGPRVCERAEKTKNKKTRGGARGPGLRGPSGLVPRVGPRGGRWWAGRPVGWSTGRVGRVGRWSDGMVALLLG